MSEPLTDLLARRPRFLLELARLEGGLGFESSIRGSSMAPAIPSLSRLRVEGLEGRPCGPGDVVYCLAEEGEFLVHRVVLVPPAGRGGLLITRGDACLTPDPPLRADRVLGRVGAVEGPEGWQPPPARRARSVWHRWAQAACLALVVQALRLGPRAARRVSRGLQWLERGARWPAGRLMRRLRLLPPSPPRVTRATASPPPPR